MVDQVQEIHKPEAWNIIPVEPNATMPRMPPDMTFTDGHLVSIISYSILMVISGIANLTVLTVILKRLKRTSNKTSMMNTMLMHLAIADLLVTFLLMPLEIGWNFTVAWKADDAMCRIMAFFRIFGLYLSGFILMCMSVDRYYAVLKPLSLSQIKTRGRLMLAAAWIGSAVCSAPQTVIFHVEPHPNFTFYKQCVTFNAFKSHYHDLAYKYFGLIMMYGLPLVVIVFCYFSILREIYKKYKACCNGSETFRRSSAGFLGRARIRTLKMTITIVMGFIICWTPYYVMCLWYWMDKESAAKVDHRIQKSLFIFASFNSLMNPIVFGFFNVRTKPQRGTSFPLNCQPKLSPIPDVVKANQQNALRGNGIKSRIWKLQWQRSFSSDRPDFEDVKIGQPDKTTSGPPMSLQKERTRSSHDPGDVTRIEEIQEVTSSACLSSQMVPPAEVRRYKWQQRPQRSSLSDNPEHQGKGWRSWLSHNRVVRRSTDDDLPPVVIESHSDGQLSRPSIWRGWLGKQKQDRSPEKNNQETVDPDK